MARTTQRLVALAIALAVVLACSGAQPPPATSEDAPPPDPSPPPESTATTPEAPSSSSEPAAPSATAPPVDASAPPAAPAKHTPTAPPPLPEGTTILHIGDSFAGALGIDLNKELKARGVKGVLKYLTASYIPTWASSKDLTKYLWQYKPDLVIVTLGANELEVPDPEIRAETIQRLVKRLDGRPCVWVAPPLWEGARDVLLPVIKRNSKPCVFLSSAEIAADMPRARDKIHPSMNARRQWARFVIDWLARHRVPDADRPWEMRGDD